MKLKKQLITQAIQRQFAKTTNNKAFKGKDSRLYLEQSPIDAKNAKQLYN